MVSSVPLFEAPVTPQYVEYLAFWPTCCCLSCRNALGCLKEGKHFVPPSFWGVQVNRCQQGSFPNQV